MDETDDVGPEHVPVRDGSPWPWLIGTAFPFFALMAFSIGHGAIDRSTPDQGAALFWYFMAAAAGTTVLVLAILRHQSHMRTIGLIGGIGAVLFAMLLGSLAEDSYGPGGSLGMFLVFLYFIIPTTVLGYGTTMLVLGLRRGADGVALACLIWGTILTVGTMLAAMYHVFTLDHQAELAAEAHEAPGGTIVASLAVLVGAVLMSRRSRC